MRSVAALVVFAWAIAGCGGDPSGGDDLTVFAASSLTEAFTAIGAEYERVHPDADLTFNFASSSDLARQAVEGAQGDVFVSADAANMAKVTEAGIADGAPIVFASNRAEIIVAPDNPLGIERIEDLTDPELVVVVCAPEVPCGRYAADVFDAAGIEVTPDSLEENVKAVVSKVTLGEADAGIVYATDVRSAGDAATGVPIPGEINVTAEYPIVAIGDEGADFVDFVLAPAGQQLLASFGFGAP